MNLFYKPKCFNCKSDCPSKGREITLEPCIAWRPMSSMMCFQLGCEIEKIFPAFTLKHCYGVNHITCLFIKLELRTDMKTVTSIDFI